MHTLHKLQRRWHSLWNLVQSAILYTLRTSFNHPHPPPQSPLQAQNQPPLQLLGAVHSEARVKHALSNVKDTTLLTSSCIEKPPGTRMLLVQSILTIMLQSHKRIGSSVDLWLFSTCNNTASFALR